MDIIYYIFAAMTLTAFVLGALAVWAPRRTWVRFVAVAAVSLFLPLAYVQLIELLSRPKPMEYAWYERAREKAIVLGVDFDEGQAIYLWLRLPEETAPRYYSIPWNPRFAEQLQDGLEDAVRRNSVLIITNPFSRQGPEDLGDLNVEIQPPPQPPLKAPQVPPRIIDPREFKI